MMSAVSRWMGLIAFGLLASCGGERRESSDSAAEGAAVTDSAPAPSTDTAGIARADTAASAATDTSSARVSNDTSAKPQAKPPATPAKPAPAVAAKPAPAAPAKPTPTAAAPDTASAKQDTAVTARPDAGTGQTQTAEAPLRDAYHQAPRDTVSQEVYDGWKQFNLNCARCHGEDVQGTTIAPHLILSLKPDGPINTPELFTQVVCAGRPDKGMPSWCALGMDPAKISQIYAYVKGRSEGKIHPGRPAVKPQG